MRIPESFIDDVLTRTDIVEIIGTRVALKRAGKEYSACCPFHDERSPSFTVSPTKQFYHCFGCGAHGSAISFLMDYDRLDFLDAVEELAKRLGMEMPTKEGGESQAAGLYRTLYPVLDAARMFYQKQLSRNLEAQNYLQQRKIDAHTAEVFQLGYAPNSFSALQDALGKNSQQLELLEQSGLLSKNDRGQSYDKFRQRILFPILDRRGRTIGFGGRVLGDGKPKYLNSPETALFHKGNALYGLWQARQAQQHLPYLIVVEGYMDVLALYQAGITQAVATLGTATTPEHAELLFRTTTDVYFCFDGDAAGRKAAWRALEAVLPRMKDGRQAFFLFLPEQEDPDTMIRKEGREAFVARMQTACGLSQFFFDTLSQDIRLDLLDGKARFFERAAPLIARIPDGPFADLMHAELRRLTGIVKAPPKAKPPTTKEATESSASLVKNSLYIDLVSTALKLVLQSPHLAAEISDIGGLEYLRDPSVVTLCRAIIIAKKQPNMHTAALLAHFVDTPEYAHLCSLALADYSAAPALWGGILEDIIFQLQAQGVIQRIDDLRRKKKTRNAMENSELLTLLAVQNRLKKRKFSS